MVVLFETDDVGAPVLTERLELPPPLVSTGSVDRGRILSMAPRC
jgi:hypothetical protein